MKISGGELTAHTIRFELDKVEASVALRGMYCGKGHMFLIPPFDTRVDLVAEDYELTFHKYNKSDFTYEEAKAIIQKAQLFSVLDAPTYEALLKHARTTLLHHQTYFFPEVVSPVIEISTFHSWVQWDIYGENLPQIHRDLIKDVQDVMPEEYNLNSNSYQTFVFRNVEGTLFMMPPRLCKKFLTLLISYHLIPLPWFERLVDNALSAMVKESAHQALYHIKEEWEHEELNLPEHYLQVTRLLTFISDNGELHKLNDQQKRLLLSLYFARHEVDEHFVLSKQLKHFLKVFLNTYGQEIKSAYEGKTYHETADKEDIEQERYDEIERELHEHLSQDAQKQAIASSENSA